MDTTKTNFVATSGTRDQSHLQGCMARAGEPEYANIVRNRSGQDAGEIDFNVRVFAIQELCHGDKVEIIRVANAMARTIEEYAGLCPGCGQPELHKMCPAHGTDAYMNPRHPEWGRVVRM